MKTWKVALSGVVAVVAIAVVYAFIRPDTRSQAAAPQMQAMPVPVANVEKKTIPIYLDYSARTESIRNVALQAKIAGYVQDQPAADGADVETGALLYQIDPRDYRAALDQAKAQLQRDTAAFEYAKLLSQRGNELGKSGALPKDTIDQRNSDAQQGQATVASDQAAVKQAENNLAYTEIRAPFAGRVGRNKAPVGTLINGAGTTLNTIVQLDPIYVTFNPSETELAQIQKAKSLGSVGVEITLPSGDSRGTPRRTDLHRQFGGSIHWHDRRACDDPEQGFQAAAWPVCAGARSDPRAARHAYGTASGGGLQPVGQVSLRHRRRQQGSYASGHPRTDRWREGRHPRRHPGP